MQYHPDDNIILDRLADEREFMRMLLNRSWNEPEFHTSTDFDDHIANLEETFFFPLNWIADENPKEFCDGLGLDFDALSVGKPAQKLALRIQMLDSLLDGYHVNPAPDHEYDIFISHATEDKADFVRPLAEELHDLQVKVWYDEFELSVGDSLRRSIDHGISKSKYGIVVLSPAFLAKNWTQYELDGLVARQLNRNKVILPIWYNLSHADILEFSPSLADIVAWDANRLEVSYIAMLIKGVVRGRPDG